MRYIFKILLFVILLSSCQENDIFPASENVTESTSTSYSIPLDSAISYLYDFMDEKFSMPSRASEKRVIASAIPIKYNRLVSRASDEDLDCENLVYIANFENNQGYAILAADERISDKVIAITDTGSLTDGTVYTAMDLLNEDRVILDEYPKSGDGFFTTPETGDELFMNPNTVILYNDSVRDTLVGNFSLDDIGAVDENGNPVISISERSQIPETLTSALCLSYAINQIKNNDGKLVDSDPEFKDTDLGGGGDDPSKRTETTASDWSVKQIVNPILYQMSNWNQDAPFNELYPMRHKYLIFGKKRHAPAGCFPLAISKIMTYFEHPNTHVHDGYTINWKELKRDYKSNIGRTSAAHLLKDISSSCNSWYFYEGTFTFPNKATSYMRQLGFNNAHSHSYSFERVTNMLDNGKPLIIYSVPGINVFKSHSWNIDGYKIKERTVTTKIYSGSTLIKSEEKTETTNMVHCDFGWSGNCNGYYVSGVFKLNDSQIEHDPGTNYGGKTNYNNLLKVITYEFQ